MNEIEKMKLAKIYVDKLANGINPIDNTIAADSDIINNIHISRCLFYVSDILEQVINNNGIIGKAKKKLPFFISEEDISRFIPSDTPITISEITNRINELADLTLCKRLQSSVITSWLVNIGAMKEIIADSGKNVKRPTEQGADLGIFTEKRFGMNGMYTVVLYKKEAQQFIADNIEAIIENNNLQSATALKNQGQPWTAEQESLLAEMFGKNATVAEIASALNRTATGIQARLKKMGLIENRGDAR